MITRRTIPDWAIRYGIALTSVALATGGDVWLRSLLGRTLFFLPFGAIAITSITSGWGPGVLAVLLSTFALEFFLRFPARSVGAFSSEFAMRVTLFFSAGFIVSWLGGSLRETSNKLRSALEALKREREFRERLVVGLAHDIRNPMTAAKATICLVRRQTDTKTTAHLARVTSALERADDLVQDFLDISQAEAGRGIQLQKENCDVVKVLSEIAEEYRFTHPGRIRWVTEVESLPTVLDCRALRRIVDNLLNNALKYGDHTKEVTLSFETTPPGMFSISVHNWGASLSLDLQQNLFCFFERTPEASCQRGWGLGLAVVKELADAHRGSIELKSTEKSGTFFIVRLPVEKLKSAAG